MTAARKVDLLYKKARGQSMDASPAELMELKKYKVGKNEGSFLATKANIRAYVNAVDNGNRRTFYDWCIDNGRADKRRKGSNAKDIKSYDKSNSIGAMLIGWLLWGLAIYWIFQGSIAAGQCAVIGAVVSAIIYKINRRNAIFTLFILPIVIAVIFGSH